MSKPKAYVSGIKPNYRLNVPLTLPPAVLGEFVELNGMQFTMFRAAQSIANAINIYAAKVRS